MDSSFITSGVVTTAVVMPAIATVCVGLRFAIRMRPNQGVSADDWMALISLILSWAMSVNTFVAGGKGGVDKISTDAISAARAFLLCMWISAFPFAICLATVKIAVLLLYRRIFVVKWFRIAVWTMIAILTAWAISTVAAQLLVNDPIDGSWADPLHPSYRFNYNPLGLSVACLSLAFDVIVLLFPIRPISQLQMPLRRKIAVIGIFWLGGFCCIAGAVRVYWVYKSVHLVVESTSVNRYEYATNFYIWEHIEPNTSIMAACLPTFAPLFTNNRFRDLSLRLRSLLNVSLLRSDKNYTSSAQSDSTTHLANRSGEIVVDESAVVRKITEIDVEMYPLPEAARVHSHGVVRM